MERQGAGRRNKLSFNVEISLGNLGGREWAAMFANRPACPGSHRILWEDGPQGNNALPRNAELISLDSAAGQKQYRLPRECDYHI